jgi:hypothetical protein
MEGKVMFRQKCVLALSMLTVVMMIAPDLLGRGRGGSRSGGGRSGGWGYSKPSKPSKPRAPKPTVSKPSSNTSKSAWGSSKSKPKPPKALPRDSKAYKNSAAYKGWQKKDKALAAKAKKNGTAFKDRKTATADFKKKYASKYTSKYTTKPAQRPDHIPQTTKVGNTTYNIQYNQQYGGYGYMGLSGWIFYDAMADAAMSATLMQRHSYHYPGAYQPVVYDGVYRGFEYYVFWSFVGIVGLIAILFLLKSMFGSRNYL